MLKKILHVIVLSLFVISTTGFSISRHYCQGKLVSFKINAEAKPGCDMSCGNCCHNETDTYQLKEDFTLVQISTLEADYSIDDILFNPLSFEIIDNYEITSIYLKKGFIPPPDLSAVLADLQSFRL